MIRIGLIGCGEHAESGHAVPLARYKNQHPDEIELAAACDLEPERARAFCRKYGFLGAYGDVEEMLVRAELDGCIAVVPVKTIPQLGISLLRRGIPCVLEKPLGSSIETVSELLKAARATGTPNMVSVNRRFMPWLNQAIDWARCEGQVRYVRGSLARHARIEPEFLETTAVHAVDTLRYIAGPVATAQIRTLGDGRGTSWYAIDLRFENGISGHIDVLPTAGMVEEVYELIGEGFRASVTCPFGDWRGWRGFRDGRLIAEEVAAENMPEDVLNGSYDEAREFIRAVSRKDTPHPSVEEVFPSVALCLALAKRLEQGGEESGAL
jgi:predicted dehydrogenase